MDYAELPLAVSLYPQPCYATMPLCMSRRLPENNTFFFCRKFQKQYMPL